MPKLLPSNERIFVRIEKTSRPEFSAVLFRFYIRNKTQICYEGIIIEKEKMHSGSYLKYQHIAEKILSQIQNSVILYEDEYTTKKFKHGIERVKFQT